MMAIRPPGIGDLVAVARAILAAPEAEKEALPIRIFAQAADAMCWHIASGGPHPAWGTGSLMSAAMRLPLVAEPTLSDRHYRRALVAVLRALDELECDEVSAFSSDGVCPSAIIPADGGADHG
ncbi:MAG: hypothetical protein ACRCSU_17415 [Paracoccaceae bacterium]